MSANKACNKFQNSSEKITEQKIAAAIAKTLRENFPKDKSVVKHISRETGLDERSVWNWYNGLYTPSLLYFIRLSQKFPNIIRTYLELCNMPEIWDIYQNYEHLIAITNNKAKIIKYEESYSDIFPETHVTINFSILKRLPNILNKRQVWFLKELQLGVKSGPSDIAEKWDVTLRTAKRDISLMQEKRLIKFKGSRKYGRYYIS